MADCSAEVSAFQKEKVVLNSTQRSDLRDHRNTNRKRCKDHLKADEKPEPYDFLIQGSYAMRTMVQHPDGKYDIDDGAVFRRGALLNEDGSAMDPASVRQMVCDSVTHGNFKTPPEAREKCVRVYYDEGHHVDIPVYRDTADQAGYEIAYFDEWKESNPKEVTKWFGDRLESVTQDDDDQDDPQMRRMVRLFKAFAVSQKMRGEGDMASGFILSILVDEHYNAYDSREDRLFISLANSIVTRLDKSFAVKHPVSEEVLSEDDDAEVANTLDRLRWASGRLSIVLDPQCARSVALQRWSEVFDDDYFKDKTDSGGSGSGGPTKVAKAEPKAAVNRKGGEQAA